MTRRGHWDDKEIGTGMTKKGGYLDDKGIGTGMTKKGGYLNDILPCGLKSQRSYSYGGMIWKNL